MSNKIFFVLPIPLPLQIIIIMLYALADRGINLEMEDCLEWVRSRLQERGCKPFEFVRTAPCYDPSRSNFGLGKIIDLN